MRISFLVERPTQFEVPFFRHASFQPEGTLRVLYTEPTEPGDRTLFDPELGRDVSWGFDLLAGYDHATVPRHKQRAWWHDELARHRPELLIVNGYTQRGYLKGALAARRAGVPAALRIDSVLFTEAKGRRLAKHLAFRLLLNRLFRLYFAVGSPTADYLAAYGVPRSRIAFFTYAIDTDAFRRRSALSADERLAVRRKLGLPEAGKVALAVAKLNPREAPFDLLNAAAALGPEAPFLALAGDGLLRRELEALIRQLRLERVRLLGYVPYPELPSLYAAVDLFVHAAREERWGVSVAEAMACGLPVIASSRVGAGHDLIAPGKNGFRYESGHPGELANTIRLALALPRAAIERANGEILARWDYAATWQGILRAAGELAR